MTIPVSTGTTTTTGSDVPVLAAPAAGKVRFITSIHIQTADATKTTITLKEDTGGPATTIRLLRCANDGDGIDRIYPPGQEWGTTKGLYINQSAGATVIWTIEYVDR